MHYVDVNLVNLGDHEILEMAEMFGKCLVGSRQKVDKGISCVKH